MHAHSIAGFLSAWVVAYVAIATFCFLATRRERLRGREADFVLFGVFCLALSVHTAGAAALHLMRDGAVVRMALLASDVGRVLGAALLVHVVAQLSQVRLAPRVLVAIYGAAALLGGASIVEHVRQLDTVAEAPVSLLGLSVVEVATPAHPLAALVSVGSFAAAIFGATVFVRSALRGRADLLPSLWGSIAFVVSTGYDALYGVLGQGKPLTSPYAYAAFVMGVVMSLLSRYVALRQRLEERASELKQRSAEIARAYEELRAAQAELVRKEQLAAVGELSAVIAHEVRNPLAIITTAVATLRREGLGEDDRQTLLGILDEEASRLNRLVGDLLRYARPVRCERQLVAPREIVERALSLSQNQTAVKVTLVEPEPLEKIHADPMLLRQVFENIVTNAMQAMPTGGALTVTLVPHAESGASGVEVRVADTGEGMDTSVRDRALDPFFTTRAAGTGLGLAIVARIVDAHGGRLSIESDVGAGTEVRIFLPQQGEPAPGRRSVPPEISRTSSLPPMPVEVRRAFAGRKA
ncbi:ATP-binding protein [Polyangium fumosum]|uniref:sensor histidine kinase n=1 Tax=Polyangium fumosum TaxID=889272 RepID=UPI001478077C|nr:ATP-binding protein [Polyangium fumosum]